MFPTDSEFSTLYFFYAVLFGFIVYKFVKGGKPERVWLLATFVVSISLNAYLYYDPGNFKGGASLGVLVYSGIIFLAAAGITVLISFIFSRKKKGRK